MEVSRQQWLGRMVLTAMVGDDGINSNGWGGKRRLSAQDFGMQWWLGRWLVEVVMGRGIIEQGGSSDCKG